MSCLNFSVTKCNSERNIKNSIMPKVTMDNEMSCISKETFKLLYHGIIYFKKQVKTQLVLFNTF